jgi:hypothetical protein
MLVRGTEAVFSVASGQDQGIRGIRDQAKRKQGHRGQAQKCNPWECQPSETGSVFAACERDRQIGKKMGP